MFSNLFNNIAQRLSGLNPIKGFIKYALDKFLNQLINDEIKLEDFKGGCLNLSKIGFNVDKVNMKHLVSSPYILHSGSIGNLKIQLPPLSELSRKSIEVQVKQVLIELKPNKNFYHSFKQAMIQRQQNMMFDTQQQLPDQQISQNNPMDYFKQTLKQILLNIKVKVQNIVIKIYMNNLDNVSSQNNLGKKQKKNQFYVLVRIPMINVHKSNDYKTKVSSDVQEIKLDIQMPQFTMHLLNEGISAQDYYSSNQNKNQPSFQKNHNPPTITSSKTLKDKGYPFTFPTVNHPSTILLFGLHDYKSVSIQTDKNVPRLTFSITTDYKNKKRQMKISALASNIQIMVDPLQIKVFSRFIYQIKEFKQILDYVKNELNLHNQSQQTAQQDINFLRRSKSSQKRRQDIFSSICLSLWQPQGNSKIKNGSKIKKSSGGDNLINNLIKENTDLTKSIHNFNVQFKKNLQEQQKNQPKNGQSSQIRMSQISQLRVVNFQKNMQINLQVNDMFVYIFKTNTNKPYKRKWMSQYKQKKINTSIPLSYFMFSIKNFKFNFKEQAKTNQISISKLKLENVKLNRHNYQENKVVSQNQNQFFDIRSSSQFFASCRQQFQSFDDQIVSQKSAAMNKNIMPSQNQLDLEQFQLGQKDHYCIEQIIRISHKASQNLYTEKIRKYNFLPKSLEQEEKDYVVFKPGFKFVFSNKKSTPIMKIDILEISISLNPQIVKQLLDIYLPVFHFKKLSQLIKQPPKNSTIMQSSYKIPQKQKLGSQMTMKSNNNLQKQKKRSLLESQYNFGVEYVVVQEYIDKKQKPHIKINIEQINLGFYQSFSQDILTKNGLFQNYHSHGPKFTNKCFCNLNSKGLYFQCFSIQIDKKQQDLKSSLKKIVTGFIELKNSKIQQIKALFIIDSGKNQRNVKLFVQKNQEKKYQNVFLIVPGLSLVLEEEQILSCISLIKTQIHVAQALFQYKRDLTYSMDQISKQAFNRQKKPPKKNINNYDLHLQLYVQTSRIVLLKTQIYLKHIYLKKYNDQISFKLSTFVLSLRQTTQLFLNQMKNQQLCIREFIQKQKTNKFGDIPDSSVILEINNETYKAEKFESQTRLLFFDKLAKTEGAIVFFMNKNSSTEAQSNNSKIKQAIVKGDKFAFTKKPSLKQNQLYTTHQNSVIMQQQQTKNIILNFCSPIYLSASNVFRLLQNKQKIDKFIQKINTLQNQIILESKALSLPQRKNSTDSDIQKLEQMKIKISAGKLNIDIRPSFSEKLYQKAPNNKSKQKHKHNNSSNNKKIPHRQIVFCSTRSYLEFDWDVIDIKIQKRIDFIDFKGKFNIKYYFLQHEQRQLTTNPVFIHEKQLIPLGFICIFELKQFDLNFQMVKKNIKVKKGTEIALINYQSSISTLSYLQLHVEHFTNHNIKRNFGLTILEQQQRFQVLQMKQGNEQAPNNKTTKKPKKINQVFPSINPSQQEQDFQIQDLTNAFQKYSQKLDNKKKNELAFKQKPFIQPKLEKQTTELFIQLFKIKQFKIKIYSGNDFEFLSCQSLNESKQKKRSRINDTQILKYLELRIDHFTLGLKIQSFEKFQLQVYNKIQNFQINYSFKKKKQGLSSWFTSNKYSEQVIFPILRNEGEVKFLIEISDEKTYFKMNKTNFQFGFTSELLELLDEIKLKNEVIKDSGWKKVYQEKQEKSTKENNKNQIKEQEKKKIQEQSEQKQVTQNNTPPTKLLLIFIPQNRLNIKKLIYKGIQILSNQSISAKQFLLHEQITSVQRINKIVVKWVKKLILSNVTGLVTGTAINFIGNILQDMLQVVKFSLGVVFRNNEAINDQ